MADKIGNYLETRLFFHLLRQGFVFVDSKERSAVSLFNRYRHQIRIRFERIAFRQGDRYHLVFRNVRKKDALAFRQIMDELRNKMQLTGYTDYDDYCEKILTVLNED